MTHEEIETVRAALAAKGIQATERGAAMVIDGRRIKDELAQERRQLAAARGIKL